MDRFDFTPILRALDEVADLSDTFAARRALNKLQFLVLGTAWVEYALWDPDMAPEDAMAYAWEDMGIALRGYGDAALTGAVVHFWSGVGKEHWEAGREILNEALQQAEDNTSATVARRFLRKYRQQLVRTPDMGFKGLPAVIPVTGPRVRDWARTNGMPPLLAEEAMARLEELERMGLLQLDDTPVFVGHNGEEIVPEAQAVRNPACAGGERPSLHLVE